MNLTPFEWVLFVHGRNFSMRNGSATQTTPLSEGQGFATEPKE
jgi:hypothetical protein